MSLQLSDKFSLPKEAVLWTFAFLAIRGAGKTYDAAKLAEQILKLNYPIVVFDPMGIWWGLRVGVNGHEGFPVLIIGGQHQDLPIPLQSAKKGFSVVDETKLREMVNGILETGLSVIVDTSSLSSRTQQTRTVAFFADELFKRNARFGIRHVFIEEADVYVPQKPLGETQASHTAIDNLVRRGGNFNLGCTMISQRSAVIDKDVLSQANCLVALRILYVRDKDAIREWVKNAVKNEAEMKRLAKWYDSLKKLKDGEAWIYSPEHQDLFEKVQFGERETLHASREYFLQETWEQRNITLRDVTTFVNAYKAKVEPKPKVQAGLIGTQPGVPVSASPKVERLEIRPSEPVVPTGNSPAPETFSDTIVQQSLPTIEIHQYAPVIRLPVEALDEPTSPLGRVCVVLKNGPAPGNRNDQWNQKNIIARLVDHAWPIDGVEAAIHQLIRWEILTRRQQYLKFDPERVVVTKRAIVRET